MADNDTIELEDLEKMSEQDLFILMDDIKMVLAFRHGVILQ